MLCLWSKHCQYSPFIGEKPRKPISEWNSITILGHAISDRQSQDLNQNLFESNACVLHYLSSYVLNYWSKFEKEKNSNA